MSRTRHIYLFVYDGFEVIDLAGPGAVFAAANTMTKKSCYEITLVSSKSGQVSAAGGVNVLARSFRGLTLGQQDTLLVSGAQRPSIEALMADKASMGWIAENALRAKRYGSICAGAFLLAKAGLLDEKRATTHWWAEGLLRKLYPSVHVQSDALYIQDGAAWTSAGASAGIDMTMAMLAEDHGKALAGEVAKYLVLYAHRPGHQSQFSTLLDAQTAGDGQFSDVIGWIETQLSEPIKVSDMAREARMSERSFHRKFTAAVGVTPSKYLEAARLERAKQLLEAGLAVKATAAKVGFRSEAGFRSAFEARFGLSPSLHKTMHAKT